MPTRRAQWQTIAGPFSDHSRAMLEGNWQSCRESDGRYGERIYDGRWAGLAPFELHMGPYHELALFRGIQDDHREHASPDNLLNPFTVELRGQNASRSCTWMGCTSRWCSPADRASIARAGS